MSAINQAARKRTVIGLLAATALIWLLVFLSGLGSGVMRAQHSDMGVPVLSGFAETRADVQKIRFTTLDDTYTLARTARGWVMEEADGYPIRMDRLSELVGGLEVLSYGPRRTDDPAKLNRIGLGDPAQGGTGVLIEVFGPNGGLQNAVITGRKGDYIYVRSPDDAQAFRAIGNLPPFYTRRAWLDFDIISIDASAISSVRLINRLDEQLYLRRPAGGGARSFVPAPPNQDDELLSRLAASTAALAIVRLSAIDVKSADALTTAPIGRHISETFDGLEIDLRAYREPDGVWVSLRAVEAGEGARRAQAINDKAEGWAFELSEYDFQDFVPPLDSLVKRAVPEEN